jgi:hypothetical protein
MRVQRSKTRTVPACPYSHNALQGAAAGDTERKADLLAAVAEKEMGTAGVPIRTSLPLNVAEA